MRIKWEDLLTQILGIMYLVKANFVKRNYKVHNYKY